MPFIVLISSFVQPDMMPNEMGYYLCKEARGKGLATRAMQLMCDYFFLTLRQQTAYLSIKPGNEPSIRLAERLHFKRIQKESAAAAAAVAENSSGTVCGGGACASAILFQRSAPTFSET